jgi:carbon storage regulator CsrA
MLVLSRKPSQVIVFPELGIRVMVVEIKGGSVKIGIEADRRHTVLREELIPQQEQPAQSSPGSTAHVAIIDPSASSVG